MIQENKTANVILKPHREKSVLQKHPWIFSGAVDHIEGAFEPGDIITISSCKGIFLGKGFISPESQIIIRMLTFQNDIINNEWFKQNIISAFQLRKNLIQNTNAFRVFHAESDGIPGCIIDKYDSVIVLQCNTIGLQKIKKDLVEIIKAIFSPLAIIEKSDTRYSAQEEFQAESTLLFGESAQTIKISENERAFFIRLYDSQKTGFYLDQRDNRKRLSALPIKSLLNCFSFTAGFGVYAALSGASTINVDTSEPALETARQNYQLNQIDPHQHQFIRENVFQYLRNSHEFFDGVILDPPAFIKNRSQIEKGSRAYKDLIRLGLMRVKSGGYAFCCSCSHHLSWDLFQKIIFSASLESNRKVQIIGRFGQPPDHPISVFHPEGEYLKTFLVKVEGN